jgi:hypothetical protein
MSQTPSTHPLPRNAPSSGTRRELLAAVAALALLTGVGCAATPSSREEAPPALPAATPAGAEAAPTASLPPAAGGTAAPTATPPATCSAAGGSGPLAAQPRLPAAVARTREAIHAAATACDFETLGALAGTTLHYSFGAHGDPVGSWRAAEARGEPVLRHMAELLSLAPGQAGDLWVWPGFFLVPAAEWTAAQREEADRLLAGADVPLVDDQGQYLGWRLGIAGDGGWRYFVAGD